MNQTREEAGFAMNASRGAGEKPRQP